MKTFFLAGIIICLTVDLQGQMSNVKSPLGSWTVNAFEQKVFIENKGQFEEKNISGLAPVRFGIQNLGSQIYFSSNGLIFRYDVLKNPDAKELDGENEIEEKKNTVTETCIVQMEWVGANSNVEIIAEEKTSDYYTFSDSRISGNTITANAYRKITYKNLYPGIDAEYFFTSKEGMKYNLILNPGADASIVKMKYSGQISIRKNQEGDIILQTCTGDVIDHHPVLVTNANQNLPCDFHITNNTVSFIPGKYNRAEKNVIDPWVISPVFTSQNKAFDIGKDAAGNIYLFGGGGGGTQWKVKKFTSAGTLLWTYTVPFSAWYGDFAVDKVGNTYIVEGCCANYSIKLNTAGAVVYTNILSGTRELWRLSFNCDTTRLFLGMGYFNTFGSFLAEIDMSNGNFISSSSNQGAFLGGEIRSLQVGRNNNLYVMAQAPNGTSKVAAYNSAYTNLFNTVCGYSLAYNGPTYANGSNPTSGQNGIAVSTTNIYSSDGATLKRFNINTGAFINQIAIPGGIVEGNSGVFLDHCSNVYAGSSNGVYKFDSLLAPVANAATPGAVYDICSGSGGEVLACGNGFLSSLALSVSVFQITSQTQLDPACNACNGTATVNTSCGFAPITYLWSNGQTSQTDTSLCPGNYSVIISDGACHQLTAYFTLVVNANNFTVTITSTNAGCGGPGSATANPNGGNGPFTYLWSNTQTTQTVTGLAVGNYTVTVTDAQGCTSSAQTTIAYTGLPPVVSVSPDTTICFGQSATLTASGATAYLWSPAAGLNTTTGSSVIATPTNTTIYFVIGTDTNGCADTAQVTVTINPIPVVTVSPDTAICEGQSTTLTAGGANTYSWNPATGLSSTTGASVTATPAATTTYIVTGDVLGCTATAQVTVTINPIPNVTVSPDVSICIGQSTTLTAGGANTYSWSPATSLNTATGSSVTANPNSTITYTVTGDALGCTATAMVTVTVINLPIVSVDSAIICEGQSALLNASGANTYSWNPSSSLSSSAGAIVNAFPNTTTIYTVTGNISGCTATAQTTVTVYPKPTAAFSFTPQTAIPGTPIVFTDLSFSNIISWNWNFGDGSAPSNVQNPVYTYNHSGFYTIQLIVSNNNSCLDSAAYNIIIKDEEIEVWIPNAFTPNGDNINELFTASGIGIVKFEMTIFDRWGMEIFHTADLADGWNGKFQNNKTDCLMDVYVYLVKAWDSRNVLHRYVGRVSLVR